MADGGGLKGVLRSERSAGELKVKCHLCTASPHSAQAGVRSKVWTGGVHVVGPECVTLGKSGVSEAEPSSTTGWLYDVHLISFVTSIVDI